MMRLETPYTLAVKQCYREIVTSTSYSFNELETPYWLDGYTGLPDDYEPELDELIPEKREIGGDGWLALAEAICDLAEAELEPEVSDAGNRPAPASPWTKYVTRQRPYADHPKPTLMVIPSVGAFEIEYGPEKAYAYETVNGKRVKVSDPLKLRALSKAANGKWDERDDERFVLANAEGPGSLYDPEDEKWDDRGYVPPPIQGISEMQTTAELGDLFHQAQRFTDPLRALSQRVIHEYQANGTSWDGILGALDWTIRHSKERQQFLDFMNDKAHSGYEPQDLLIVFLSVQTPTLLNEGDMALITVPGPHQNLHAFFRQFGDEILENRHSSGLSSERLNDDEIAATCDRFLVEILNTYPERDKDTTRTRLWNEHFIRAVIEGAPLYYKEAEDGDLKIGEPKDDRKMTAYDLAWMGWRSATSPTGARAFSDALRQGKSMKAAWSTFYTEGRKAGEIKDVIVKVNQKGLVVTPNCGVEERAIDWRIATIKAKANEFDFRDMKDKLLEVLRQTGWAPQFLKALA